MGNFEPGAAATYPLKKEGNGVYVFVLSGKLEAAGIPLEERDGLGIWETADIPFRFIGHSRVLLMEVPMT
jgi:redox-sensitive bicupin YhaK (pirin superfamily)